jgi:ribosomal protein S18 acetylase RimI-like enzyme
MKQATPPLCRKSAAAFVKSGRLPAGFSLRPCGLSDLDALLELGREGFSYNVPTRRELRYAVTRLHGGLFGLFDSGDAAKGTKGRPAGYVLLEAHAGRKNLYINTVLTGKDYRGRGLGQALYDFMDHFSAALQARAIWCHVAKDNRVNIHLLEKNGYRMVREEKAYYSDGKPAIVLKKEGPFEALKGRGKR